ncbi:deoxycytidine triphosphate deaminase [Nostoc sp. ATCC 43529]|nr:deoxycytidine triphosphate deaminase [Nostoc sp. ATCC 43529]
MIKNDIWITEMAQKGMISPFEPSLIRKLQKTQSLSQASLESELSKIDESVTVQPVISYGLSSYGYDIRLSPAEFRIFRHIPGTVVDPKNFNPHNLEPTALHTDVNGSYFILPAHSYGLGVALEKLEVPSNITVICIGKSTYARCGIIANLTPAEAAWRGHLTLEFSNSSSADCRIYANEGVVQLLFLEGEPCAISYEARRGKYQDQLEIVTLARV